jgi:formylglycine-generating enzyme required for sulfatase activity
VRVQAIHALERLATDDARHLLQTGLWYEVGLPVVHGHPVWYIDRFPVTNVAYQRFLEDTPDHPPPPSWLSRRAPQGYEDHPVTEVSWHDAQAYAVWANKRLPTVVEWQQVAGADQGRRYPWGNQFDTTRCNTREARLGGTTPVGHYSPQGDSSVGVADMAGNVWEWLEDIAGPTGDCRHLRGGAWMYSADFARSDFDQFWRKPDEHRVMIGFRLCVSSLHEEMEQ